MRGRAEEWTRQALLNDQATTKIVQLFQGDYANAITSLLNQITQAVATKPKYEITTATTVSATDAPSVVIERALDDWIGVTRYAEDLAVARTKHLINMAPKLDEKDVEKFVNELHG